MTSASLLIRADASVAVGTGHAMRCLALAQAWQDVGGRCVFAMADATPAVEKRLRNENIEVVRLTSVAIGTQQDSDQTVTAAAKYQAKWVVVDGYKFGSDYQRALTSLGLKVLFVDDNAHCDYYSADLVLNQNAYADEAAYLNRAPATQLLLGLRYAMLRREYTHLRERQRQIPPIALNLLVSMGGSDAMNFSIRVLQALPQIGIEAIRARIAVGGSNPHRASLEESASRIPGCVELLNDVQDMAELIAWADVGLAAAGTVTWEICVLGLPSLLVPVAENQLNAASDLERRGAARILSPNCTTQRIADSVRELMLSVSARQNISENARGLLDTNGSRRVVAAILASTNSNSGGNP